jgi:indole-3-glycerol phosphate synthase/phosphoribosylanthranilate isomerase
VSEKTHKPVLCKDFFIDQYQVYEARVYGASAVLLMLSILSDEEYCQLAEVARKLNMDVLTEVHTEEECKRAVQLGARIIGINNRDLRTLKTELATTEKLRSLLSKDTVVISESGIKTRRDIRRLAPLVDGFLVGSSLMSAPDVRVAARSLVYGDVKICGVKSSSIARACFDSGANYVGLMFYPSSPRYVSPQQASEISHAVPGNYVGVFVNQSLEDIVQINQQCRLDVLQLHGDESIDFARLLKQQLSFQKVWKAISVTETIPVEEIKHWLEVVDKVVLDCRAEGLYGGSGESFNWGLLDELFQYVDENRIVIAGGVNDKNIRELQKYSGCAIDLSSGVEVVRGEKSAEKIQQLFHTIRCAS